ncbi:MAG: hypothetical protein ATN31_07305 [Candidatus Epulonipiscioides saccharophilum]|nr:MAG: hypothetical protein ATN31_07305 [Epulopiscium sp. AS2M-Bin001]
MRIESNQFNPQDIQARNAQQNQIDQRQNENQRNQNTPPVSSANQPAAVYDRSRPPVNPGTYQRPRPQAPPPPRNEPTESGENKHLATENVPLAQTDVYSSPQARNQVKVTEPEERQTPPQEPTTPADAPTSAPRPQVYKEEPVRTIADEPPVNTPLPQTEVYQYPQPRTQVNPKTTEETKTPADAPSSAPDPEINSDEVAQSVNNEVTDQKHIENAGTPHSSEETVGLSADQLSSLQNMFAQQQTSLFSQMASNYANNQSTSQSIYALYGATGSTTEGFSDEMIENLNKVFGSVEEAVPEIATDPEEAAAAIAEGGAYSVDKVAERLFTFAKEMSGGDIEKMKEMQDAVRQGFEEAGMDLETGSGMPDITKDTYDKTMGMFDEYFKSQQQQESTDPILPDENYSAEVQTNWGMPNA